METTIWGLGFRVWGPAEQILHGQEDIRQGSCKPSPSLFKEDAV